MAPLSPENKARARSLVALYPQPRSAMLPLCHLAQAQDGWLTGEAAEDIAALCGVTAAEVYGTATFYDMLHTEPVGRHVITICTNIACMLAGAYELLDHAEESLGIAAGGSTADGEFSLEEAECLAGCDNAPCVQVNHRFFGPLTDESFDRLVADLRSGVLAATVPPHGVLSRVDRRHGLEAAGAAAAGGSISAAAGGPTPSTPAAPAAGEHGSGAGAAS